jgi:hypothetical protein
VWTAPSANETHNLIAVASDGAGNTARDTIWVNTIPPDVTLPQVTITSPVNGQIVQKKSSISITANVVDNIGVSRVEFYINNQLKSTDAAHPYAYAWQVPASPNKTYTIKVIGYDAANNSTTKSISVVSSGGGRLSPNPFNPSVIFSYYVDVKSDIKIDVFDILGRYVTGVELKSQVEGDYEHKFKATTWSSGVYVFQITTTPLDSKTLAIIERYKGLLIK